MFPQAHLSDDFEPVALPRMMNLYVVRQSIYYEGDNMWIVAANNKDEAKGIIDWPWRRGDDIYIDEVLEGIISPQPKVLWTNT